MILRSPSDPPRSYLAYCQDRATIARQLVGGEILHALTAQSLIVSDQGSRLMQMLYRMTLHLSSHHSTIKSFVISKLAVRLRSLSVVAHFFLAGPKVIFFSFSWILKSFVLALSFAAYIPTSLVCTPEYRE